MKKILSALLLCFISVNVYALTAEEVFKKSAELFLFNYTDYPSYEVIYEMRKSDQEGYLITCKETTDGSKKRLDMKIISPYKDAGSYISMISTDEDSYFSSKSFYSEGVIFFSDYKVVNDTSSVITYDKKVFLGKDLKSMNIVFSPDQKKNSTDYIVDISVKDAKKLREDYKRKQKNNEQLTSDEERLFLYSTFETKHSISKKDYFVNMTQIKVTEEAIYEEINNSEEYKDKSEEEKRALAKDIVNKAGLFFITTFSDYKKVEGTNFFYPEKMRSFFGSSAYEQKYMETKTVSLKILKSEDIDPSIFVPPTIKKGKGKVPKEFTEGNVYSIMAEKLKNDMKIAIKEFIKKNIKEAIKEEGRNILKKGAKDAFRGLTGF